MEDDMQKLFPDYPCGRISIHVPRMEDDSVIVHLSVLSLLISIHVPRMEDDARASLTRSPRAYFNPRPPYGGRLRDETREVNTTAFQSTSPVWRTTGRKMLPCRNTGISIHVPRMEDDSALRFNQYLTVDFNPRPPYGGRRKFRCSVGRCGEFQSTSPVWRTTQEQV